MNIEDYDFYKDKEVGERVSLLIKDIGYDQGFRSNFNRQHPILLEIVKMGKVAVPHLAKHLKAESGVWYAIIALGQIIGSSPIQEKHRGNLDGIIEDWKKWLEVNDYGC